MAFLSTVGGEMKFERSKEGSIYSDRRKTLSCASSGFLLCEPWRARTGHLRPPGELRKRTAELDDLLGRLLWRRRFSALDQINLKNANTMSRQMGLSNRREWKARDDSAGRRRNPLRHRARDRAFALDARTGRPIWMYQRQIPADIRPCCGHVNRGLAILGDKVFLGTLDAHVIALDAKTGNVIWEVDRRRLSKGYSFTVAPLAVKNLIVIGVSGGEYGVRGFIDAYDATTGERKWRFYTVPGPGEPGHDTWEGDSWKVGGAPAWNTGTYDPQRIRFFGPPAIPHPPIAARDAPATISTAIPCSAQC